MAEYLLSRGADVNKVTFAGNTPLHTASGREMDQMAKLLMTHGANVNIANLEGDIPKVVRSSEQVNICISFMYFVLALQAGRHSLQQSSEHSGGRGQARQPQI